jgi:hypothetical protein
MMLRRSMPRRHSVVERGVGPGISSNRGNRLDPGSIVALTKTVRLPPELAGRTTGPVQIAGRVVLPGGQRHGDEWHARGGKQEQSTNFDHYHILLLIRPSDTVS